MPVSLIAGIAALRNFFAILSIALLLVCCASKSDAQPAMKIDFSTRSWKRLGAQAYYLVTANEQECALKTKRSQAFILYRKDESGLHVVEPIVMQPEQNGYKIATYRIRRDSGDYYVGRLRAQAVVEVGNL